MILTPLHRDAVSEFGLTYEMKANLGTELRAMWQSPEMTELMQSHLAQRGAAQSGFTQDQLGRLDNASQDRIAEQDEMGRRMSEATSDEEREGIWLEFKRLQESHQKQQTSIVDESIDAGRLYSQEVLREMYGDLLEFNRPMTPEEAELLYTEKVKETVRNHIFSRTKGGFGTAAAKFGVALLGAATDPAELAIGFLSTLVIPYSGGTIGRRALIAGGEAFLGSVLTEPLYYSLSRRQQLDYTMNEALLNIGVGTLLGGAVGVAFGPRGTGSEGVAGTSRWRKDPEVVMTAREAEMGRVALNQFVNDEPVNIAPFMRDLRGTTSLVSSRGVVFQPDLDLGAVAPSFSPPTALVLGEDFSPISYRSRTAANIATQENGGRVVPFESGFAIRQDLSGDFVRAADGSALVFNNPRRAAQFVDDNKGGLIPEKSDVVPVVSPGRPTKFAVATNMEPENIRALRSGQSAVDIPKGVDTREIEIATNTDEVLTEAVRSASRTGNAAYEDLSREYSSGKVGSSETAIDAPTNASQDMVDAAEDLEAYRTMFGETLDDEAQIDAETDARIEGIKAAMTCMVGGKR